MSEGSDDSGAVPRGGVSWVYASTVALTLAGAVFYLYLARAVPLDELGAIVILQSFAFIVSTAASLGLSRGFQHFLSYHRARGESAHTEAFVRMSYITTVLLFLVAAAIAIGLSGTLSSLLFHSGRYASTIELLSVFSGLLVSGMILSGVLLGLQRYVAYSAVSILGAIALYGTPVVFFLIRPGVESIVLGWIAGAAIQTVATVAMIERATAGSRGSPPAAGFELGSLYSPLFTYSIPILVSVLITTCTYYIDRLILASIANLPSVGIYNYVILFASASLFVVTPFQTILISRISAQYGRNDARGIRSIVRTSSTLIVLAFVPLALGLAALGPVLLRYVVGPQFATGALSMAVLLSISAAFVPFAIMVSLASATRRTTAVMLSSSCALIANAALSVALVPHLGMLGAALGNSAMFWAPFGVLYLVFRGTGLVDLDVRSIAGIWAASIVMAATVGIPLLLLGYGLIFVPVFVVIGVLLFLVLLRALRALPGEAIDELLHHLPGWASPIRPLIRWVGDTDRRPREPPPPLVASGTPEQR